MRRTRIFFVLFAGCLVSMAVAFLMTRHLLRDDRLVARSDPLSLEEANELRLLANELLELSERLEREMEVQGERSLRDWLQLVMRPSLQHYQRRVVDAAHLSAAPRSHLEGAAGQLLRLTEIKTSPEALRGGIADARQAWAATERYIESLGLQGRLSAPKRNLLD